MIVSKIKNIFKHNEYMELSAPKLVSKKTIKSLEKIFQTPIVYEPTWKDNLLLFYNDNIRPNIFAIIIFAVIGIYLTIKYLLKQEKDDKRRRKMRKKRVVTHSVKNTDVAPVAKTVDDEDDIYYRAMNNEPSLDLYNEDVEDRSEDEISYYSISKNYEKMIDDSDGILPVGILKDAHEQQKSRTTFDELAKFVGAK